MKFAWIAEDRTAEVRDAARGWRKAGAIDEATLASIEAEFPTSRLELGRAWKTLVFVLVTVAAVGVHLGVFRLGPSSSTPFLVYAAILTGVTEVLRGSRFAGTGADAATSFWAATYATVGFAVLFDEPDPTLAAAAFLWGVACWRWGFALYAPFAAGAAFLLLARLPFGRLAWVIAGAGLGVVAERLVRSPRLAPSRRRAFAGLFVAGAFALYGAVNLYSRNERLVEQIAERRLSGTPPTAGGLYAAATAIVPIVFVVWGIQARRRLVLNTGVLLAALSILTLHHYVRFGSIAITVFGLSVIGLALWLNRRLRTAPGEELRGFTTSPLTAEPGELTPAAALATAAASPISSPEADRQFAPGGGRYGGGGASGTIERG